MQRFDIYFKRIFSQYADSILALLNTILKINCGSKVTEMPSVEIIKGPLRIDKVYKTDINKILIVDFEEPFTLDSYFEVLTHTAAYIYSNKLFKKIIKNNKVSLNLVPIILSIKVTRNHLNYLKLHNISKEITNGVYELQATPFFPIYLVHLSKINLTEHLLKIMNVCTSPEECTKLGMKLKSPDMWEKVLGNERDNKLKYIMKTLVLTYGDLLAFLNFDAEYLFNVWRFSRFESEKVAKDILNSLVLLFPKEVAKLSVSKLLTKKEVAEIIETMGIKKAIEAVGIKRVIDTVGIKRVIDTVGIERVVEAIGVEKIIEVLGDILKLSDEEKKQLLKRYKTKNKNEIK